MNRLEPDPVERVVRANGDGHVAPAPSDFDKPMKSSRLPLIAILVCVIIVVAFVAGFLPRLHQKSELRGQTHDLAIPTVSIVSPAPAQATTPLALPAEVRPMSEAPIYARASGYVKKWTKDLGATVRAGEVLAEIDSPELDQELAKSRAELTQAEAALALSKTTATRWRELLQTSSVSEQENAEKQADLALKNANLEAARAAVRRLEQLQSFTRVVAPFDGTITSRSTDVGELIKADSGRELFRLAQTGVLRIFVRTPQTMARAVAPGTHALISIPELAGRVWTGSVVRTAGAIDAESRTLLTEIELQNKDGQLLSGSFAQVRFAGLKASSTLTLPSNTLLFRQEGTIVGVVDANGKVELRRVKLGRDFGLSLEILEGISASDRVIVNPADSLVDGSTVRIAQAAEAR